MDFNPYVGLSWSLGGRDPDGVDCWGLLCLFYAGEMGVQLPAFERRVRRFTSLRDGDLAQWSEVTGAAAIGDGVLFRRPRGLHVAIAAPSGRFLNIEEQQASHIATQVDGVLMGVYRLQREVVE